MNYRNMFVLSFCLVSNVVFAEQTTSQNIDQDTWMVISQSVIDADIKAMASTYHPDAVVVSEDKTTPIKVALTNWGEGMEEAKTAGSSATVSFRFASRQDGEMSAFQTGIFKYTSVDTEGNKSKMYMNFETLLVKKENRWQFLMERQLDVTDKASWDALK
jgi:ketosteroid isomerase-like protein